MRTPFYHWICFFSPKNIVTQPLTLSKQNFKTNQFGDYCLFLNWHLYAKLDPSSVNYHYHAIYSLNPACAYAISDLSLKQCPFSLSNSTFFNSHDIIPYAFTENETNVINSFSFLRNSSFINFFINNLVDTPNCFKKIKSIRRRVFELPLLKLINFLMKQGKREKFQIAFFKALSAFYVTNRAFPSALSIRNSVHAKNASSPINFFKHHVYHWTRLYLLFNSLCYSQQNFLNVIMEFEKERTYAVNYQNSFCTEGKTITYDSYVKNLLHKKLLIMSPVFTFFVHNVEKSVKKFSRGKAGKYSFVWKYVALYKRAHVTFKLIIKDIKFVPGRDLNSRIINSLKTLFSEPKKSFIWKSKIFTYNYIFKNYRKTLMQTLKSAK